MKLTSGMIKCLLAIKHSKDVFIPECKTGATWGVGKKELLILDAWTMNKKWANAKATGYEIKVSRSDFINDNKWTGYLPYCNEFYFVCPKYLINPNDIPNDIGLIWASKSRLTIRKYAQYRDVVIPVSLYQYILMARVEIKEEHI